TGARPSCRPPRPPAPRPRCPPPPSCPASTLLATVIASTTPATVNILDAPVISVFIRTGCSAGRTQECQLAFRNCEPHSPDAGESKTRQDSVSGAPKAPVAPSF